MEKLILNICGRFIPVGCGEINYNSPMIDGNCLFIDHLCKNGEITVLDDGSYYSFDSYIPYRLERLVPSNGCGCSVHNVKDLDLNEYDFDKVVQGCYVVVSDLINDNVVMVVKYQIVGNELNPVSTMMVTCDDALIFTRNSQILGLNEAMELFSGAVFDRRLEEHLKTVIYNNHKKCVALRDHQMEYLDFMRDLSSYIKAPSRMLKYWYYWSEIKVCYLFEFYKKNGLRMRDFIDAHPMDSGKLFEDVRGFSSLSSAGLKMAKKQFHGSWDQMKAMEAVKMLEDHPKIGVNGVKLISEINDIVQGLDYSCHEMPFYNGSFCYRSDFENIIAVLENFDITLKTLMDRCIRAAFLENIQLSKYIKVIVDYMEMKKMLGLPIEKKLPKNVIDLHNALIAHIEDVKSEERKATFRVKAQENRTYADEFNAASESEEFVIMYPVETEDLIAEGQEMHHCVGSYIDRFTNGYSKIYFVRQKRNPDAAFVTIELDKNNNLVQAKARFNKEVANDVHAYIQEFVKFIGGNC